jgi:hypothetical protein
MSEQNLSQSAQELLNTIRDGWIPVLRLHKMADGHYEANREYYITRLASGKIISSEALRANGDSYRIEREDVGHAPTGSSIKTPWGEDVPQMVYGHDADLDQNALWELVQAGLVEEKFYATETVAQTDDYLVFGLVEKSMKLRAQIIDVNSVPMLDAIVRFIHPESIKRNTDGHWQLVSYQEDGKERIEYNGSRFNISSCDELQGEENATIEIIWESYEEELA